MVNAWRTTLFLAAALAPALARAQAPAVPAPPPAAPPSAGAPVAPPSMQPPAQAISPGPSGQRTERNCLFVELGGSALFYSVNYERFVRDGLSLRVGMGLISDNLFGNLSIFPVTASYLGLRSGNHAFELGGGAVFVSSEASVGPDDAFETRSLGTAIVGYRYAPLDGGFSFRVAYTPLFRRAFYLGHAGIALGGIF